MLDGRDDQLVPCPEVVQLRPADRAEGRAATDPYRRRLETLDSETVALVRARFVAGDPAMGARFAAIRADVLQRAREPAQLRSDVAAMRARMRGELDRSRAGSFDLKQGEGGLVDLEFLVQALVLQHAATHPRLAAHTATPALLESLAAAGVLAEATASELRQAHATLLQRALSCMLDGRPRLVAIDSAIEQARQQVRAACCTHGIVTG